MASSACCMEKPIWTSGQINSSDDRPPGKWLKSVKSCKRDVSASWRRPPWKVSCRGVKAAVPGGCVPESEVASVCDSVGWAGASGASVATGAGEMCARSSVVVLWRWDGPALLRYLGLPYFQMRKASSDSSEAGDASESEVAAADG